MVPCWETPPLGSRYSSVRDFRGLQLEKELRAVVHAASLTTATVGRCEHKCLRAVGPIKRLRQLWKATARFVANGTKKRCCQRGLSVWNFLSQWLLRVFSANLLMLEKCRCSAARPVNNRTLVARSPFLTAHTESSSEKALWVSGANSEPVWTSSNITYGCFPSADFLVSPRRLRLALAEPWLGLAAGGGGEALLSMAAGGRDSALGAVAPRRLLCSDCLHAWLCSVSQTQHLVLLLQPWFFFFFYSDCF